MAGIAIFFVFVAIALRRSGGMKITLPRTVLLWGLRYTRLVLFFFAFAAFGARGSILVIGPLVLVFVPLLVINGVLIPFGWPRAAYWASRICWPNDSIAESNAHATIRGALALARKQKPGPTDTVDWLEDRLNRTLLPRGASLVAAGLLAALRGDRKRARRLLLVADAMAARHISRSTRTIARDWLIVDAARAGDWHAAIRLGRRGRASLRWSYTIARIGERQAGDPSGCRTWLLWLLWSASPRRRTTLPLLRRACAVPRAAKTIVTDPVAAEDWPEALAILVQCLENRFLDHGRALVQAVGAVDAALDRAATRERVQQRLLALGLDQDGEAVVSDVRRRLADRLSPIIEDAPTIANAGERGLILDQTVETVRIRLFRDIEAQCKDYNDRQKSENALGILAEWEAWAALRDTAERLIELIPSLDNAVFQMMYLPANNFAVFQHNRHKQKPFAHEVYSWLHRHAQNDAAAMQLLQKNVLASRN